jgi:hypothetical protein
MKSEVHFEFWAVRPEVVVDVVECVHKWRPYSFQYGPLGQRLSQSECKSCGEIREENP